MFFKQTIDSLIADITRKVSDLRAVGEAHAQNANELNVQAKALEQASEDAANEADRAYKIADRFAALVAV